MPKTSITIYRVGQDPEVQEIDAPERPGGNFLRSLLTPILDGAFYEHVSVLHDGQRADMFVDEEGALKRLERNEEATAIYRAAHLWHRPEGDPDSLPAIYGTAILFSRRVWF